MERSRVVLLVIGIVAALVPGPAKPRTAAAQAAAGTIAYVAPEPMTGTSDLWLTAPDGGADHSVPLVLINASYPVWSRDGRLLAATGLLPGGDTNNEQVFVVAAEGGALAQATHLNVQGRGTLALFKAFAPDGQRLAVVAFFDLLVGESRSGAPGFGALSAGTDVALLVVPLDGSPPVLVGTSVLSGNGYPGVGLDWSPRGDQLVVPDVAVDPATLLPVTALFTLPPVADAAAQGVVRQLTFPPRTIDATVDDILPAFSPDGGQLAFIRITRPVLTGPETAELRIVNADGTNDHAVIGFTGESVSAVSWSPDGAALVFDRGQNVGEVPAIGSEGLWLVHTDGTGLAQLRAGPAAEPAWRPA